MSEYNNNTVVADDSSSLRAYLVKVFTIMAIGLGITTAVAFGGYTSGLFLKTVVNFPYAIFAVVLIELGVAMALSFGISKFSPMTCRILFFVYSAMTGVTFGILPYAFGVTTVFTAFLFAAVLFVCMAVIGYTTSVDLTKFSGLMIGGLIALVITSILSLFIPVLRNSLIYSYVGLVLFLALTAWDVQKIKTYYYQIGEGTLKESMAVYSAFQLYLDFINIIMYIIRILGRNNRH